MAGTPRPHYSSTLALRLIPRLALLADRWRRENRSAARGRRAPVWHRSAPPRLGSRLRRLFAGDAGPEIGVDFVGVVALAARQGLFPRRTRLVHEGAAPLGGARRLLDGLDHEGMGRYSLRLCDGDSSLLELVGKLQ